MRINWDRGSVLFGEDHKHTQHQYNCFRDVKHCNCGLFREPMKKMFLKLALFCLCLWNLVGEFEICFYGFSCL